MKSKMKVFVVSLIFSFFAGTLHLFCNPQDEVLKNPHPFYDAKKLSEAVENGKIGKKKIDLVLKVLAKYIGDDDLKTKMKSTDNWNENLGKEIKDAFTDKGKKVINPFLQEYLVILGNALNDYSAKSGQEGDAYIQDVVTEVKAIPSPAKGFPSPVMVVDALGSFLAKRFKEELSISFLNKFRKKLEQSPFGPLFPSVRDFLLSAEIYNFKLFIPTLKEAFQNDLNDMDSNLYDSLKNIRDDYLPDKIKENQDEIMKLKENDPEKKELEKEIEELLKSKKMLSRVLFLWGIFVEFKEGKHPIGIIGNLNNLQSIAEFDDKGADYIRLIVWIARILSNKAGDGWIWEEYKNSSEEKPKDIFCTLIKDENIGDLYIGLFYAGVMRDLKSDDFRKDIKEKLEKFKEINEEIKGYIEKGINIAEKIQEKINEMKEKEKEGEKIAFENYHSYLYTIYELVELGTDIIGWVGKDENTVDKYLGYAKALLEISKNIHDKTYGVALVNALEILKKMLPENSELTKEVVKYMSFAISVVNAKNAKELQEVLEAAALPVGSYRHKRANFFNISLNAYVGAFLNNEKLTSTTDGVSTKENKWNPGLTAPIGFAFNWRLRKGNSRKIGWSFSIFAPIIDVGAVVNWRLKDENGELPEIKWKNIIAPGVFGVFGIKGSIISIGAGFQYGPQLRGIKVKEVTTTTMAADNTINGNSNQLEAVIYPSKFRF
jgi:hypothetical protein